MKGILVSGADGFIGSHLTEALVRTGYSFRMPNLNAAIGCAQLEQRPGCVAAKRMLADCYTDGFAGTEGLRLVSEPAEAESNYWFQTLLVAEGTTEQCDPNLETTNDTGLMTRPAWTLMHQLAPYKDCPRASLQVAESLARRIINLPSSVGLV